MNKGNGKRKRGRTWHQQKNTGKTVMPKKIYSMVIQRLKGTTTFNIFFSFNTLCSITCGCGGNIALSHVVASTHFFQVNNNNTLLLAGYLDNSKYSPHCTANMWTEHQHNKDVIVVMLYITELAST